MAETGIIQPLTVAVVGTGDGGGVKDGQAITTPQGQPDLVLQVVGPLLAIAVRFINTFLTGLSGILGGAMVTDVIPAADFLSLVRVSAGLALAGAGVGLIKDCVTIFSRLETKYPLLTGSV